MDKDTNTNKSGHKPPADLKEFLKQAARPFGFLLILIMICGFLAQYLTGSETLQEYADTHPESAYGSSRIDPAESAGEAAPGSISASEDDPGIESDPISKDSLLTETSSPVDPSASAGIPPAYNIPEESESDTAGSADSDSKKPNGENIDMTDNPERTIYQNGFFYEPLSEAVKQRITGISYPETGCTISYEELNYVGLLYVDFNGEVQEGELICNKAIAQDMVEIFYELYQNDYRIERVRLIDEYGGDDTLSMLDNNTSCFNYRVVDGTTSLSKHALGCAIDINPFYNPYVVFNKDGSGNTYISPKGSEIYADRSQNFPYKIDETDLCYKLFTEHGFTWGGNWNSSKDYQHFQIVL